RQVHRDLRRAGDRGEELGVTGDESRLRRDRQAQARDFSRSLEDAACDLEAPLCRLIGIGRGAEGHRLAALPRFLEVPEQTAWVDLLHVDRSLEGVRVAEPEKLVCIPSKTVMAAHLTSAIGVHGPAEWHRARIELSYEAL